METCTEIQSLRCEYCWNAKLTSAYSFAFFPLDYKGRYFHSELEEEDEIVDNCYEIQIVDSI